ncbi:hypothetical protein [Streptomyces sp. NPDC059349]|uniref:hypothetical protein n=1 Tax=Streptomyces sp. NPDC059349 TaxID=3346808 RepID=UPI003692CF72
MWDFLRDPVDNHHNAVMDGGWAAVIAGAAGAGDAGLAAWATAHAMIKQVHIQASDQHAHWLREQRQDAYVTLLAATDDVYDKLNPVIAAVQFPGSEPDLNFRAAWADMNTAVRVSGRATRRVGIVGPPDMVLNALQLQESIRATVNIWRVADVPTDQRAMQHAETQRGWERAEDAFRLAAYETISVTRSRPDGPDQPGLMPPRIRAHYRR